MATRPLSDHEIFEFLANIPQAASAVQRHEQAFLVENHPYVWDQTVSNHILVTITGDTLLQDLPIPPRGLAFDDATYGHVIIFPDAKGILHFTATTNDSLANEIRKPAYVEDPQYWETYMDILKRLGEFGGSLVPHLEFDLGALAVIAVTALLFIRKI